MEDLIKDVFDEERGCGFREEGGLYMRLDNVVFHPCGRALIPIVPCDCCGLALKQSRGFQWFNPQKIIASQLDLQILELLGDETRLESCGRNCRSCKFGMATPMQAGLIWIGAEHYPTIADFRIEAMTLGISRRIPTVPKGFKVGEDVVYLAHPHGITKDQPAIFTAFVPSAIEYVVKGDEEEDDLRKMIENGITPVRVHSDKNGEWIEEDDIFERQAEEVLMNEPE